jgi:hypothetical protein
LTDEAGLSLFVEGFGNYNTSLWIHRIGDYNSFYGIPKDFRIEYLLNPDPQLDKVFDSVEYRLDNQLID